MVRRHGWGGAPPADEEEARARIVAAAELRVARNGVEHFSISDVAADLEVTRQTVYRYFPSTGDLEAAVGVRAADRFIEHLVADLRPHTDPAEWVVEALAAAIERLPRHPSLTLGLVSGGRGLFAAGVTSESAMGFGREVLAGSAVDWSALGYDDATTDELIELMLRVIRSHIVDPPQPARSAAALRRYLDRWIAPAVRSGQGGRN